MCDDTTEAENDAYLNQSQLNRRQMGMGAGAAVAEVLTGCTSMQLPAETPRPAPTPATAVPQPDRGVPPATVGRMVTVDTPDGAAEAFWVTRKNGQYPGVILWPDVAGLRDAFMTMATRLASEGYAVLAVNQYYRSTKMPLLSTFSEWRTEAGKAKIQPLRAAITADGIAGDGVAFAAWLDQQEEVDKGRKLATSGYCMGGPFTFRTAAAAPKRVGVIASFHGGGLVTPEPRSPHALFSRINAAALICIAQNDDARDPEAKATLRRAAEAAHVPAEIEVYPAQHGWCTIDSPVYDREQAQHAWARMLATFERYL